MDKDAFGISKGMKMPKLPGAKKAAANADTWATVQRNMAATRASADTARTANAQKRAAVSAQGRAADGRAAEGRRAKAIGWRGRSGTNAAFTGTTGSPSSRRVMDQSGNSGWA